jgi:hypothetical protein
MPKILSFSGLALLSLLLFSACRPAEVTPEERLQSGKWRIHNVNDIQRHYGNVPIKDAYMEFGEDGIIQTKWGARVEKGTWVLNGEKTHICIVGDSVHANGLQLRDSFEFKFEDERTIIIQNRGIAMEFRK